MTAPPIPTFVPQDAWYSLTLGNLNPSEADTVPIAADLQPSGGEDGITGSLDGAIIYLAGLTAKLDGGQKFLMWDSTSLAVDDGLNTFCPFVDHTKPGRWRSTVPVEPSSAITVDITQGSTTSVAPTTSLLILVFITAGSSAPTTVSLPTSTRANQRVRIKDTVGNAASYPITVVGTIDGSTNDTINQNYGTREYIYNGSNWSAA